MPRVRRSVTIDVEAAPDVLLAVARDALHLDEELNGQTPTNGRVTVAVAAGRDGRPSQVTVAMEDDIHVPFFQWFFGPAYRRALERSARHAAETVAAAATGAPPPRPQRRSLLLPPVAFTEAQTQLIATVALTVVIASFGAALFGQNLNPLADSFGVSNDDLGVSLAVTRAGTLFALVATALADRRGRRVVLLGSLGAVCAGNLVSALAPTIEVFTGAQLVVRAAVNAALVVGGIAVVEEAPEGARAFSVAMLGLAGGAGFALSVVVLPIADAGPDAWRIAFLLSTLSALLIPVCARHLRETSRYEGLVRRSARRGQVREVVDRAYRRRFLLLAAIGFLSNIFSAPSAQFTNRFLEDERGFSSSGVAGFRAITAGLPGLFGILLAGRVTETRGRRSVAAVSLLIGTICTMIFFVGHGAVLWTFMTLAIVAAAPATLSIGTLDAELFPTEVRGTSNALLLVAYVLGSSIGLLVAGDLSDVVGGLGYAIAILGVAPLLAAIFLVPRLPESVGQKLDDVSPSET
jgi:AAHS family 4-hydroxybenzoate transporter-like MFS transporter